MRTESAGYRFYIKGVELSLEEKSNATLLSLHPLIFECNNAYGEIGCHRRKNWEKSATGLSECMMELGFETADLNRNFTKTR